MTATRLGRYGPAEGEGWLAWADREWFRVLVVASALLLLAGTAVQFAQEPFYLTADSALFQHAGWYIGQGATPYVDFWDLKPPLIYAVTTVLATLSLGNMAALHLLSIAVSLAVILAGVVAVGLLTHRLTGDGLASLVAGATVFVVPTLYTFPYAGIRPKYFAFCCGAGALLLAVDDRPVAAGAVAAAGAGFWQLTAGIAPLVVAMSYDRRGLGGAARALAGGVAVSAAVVLPFVLAGLTVPLFTQAVVAAALGGAQNTLPEQLLEFVLELSAGVFLLPLGGYGIYRACRADWRRYWWVAVGASVYLLAMFVNMEGSIDTVLLLPFLAVGVGYLVATVDGPPRPDWPEAETLLVAAVAVMALSGLYWTTTAPTPVKDRIEGVQESVGVEDFPPEYDRPLDAVTLETIYWKKQRPETCHYRLSKKEMKFLDITGQDRFQRQCGDWPFADPPVQWLVARLVP